MEVEVEGAKEVEEGANNGTRENWEWGAVVLVEVMVVTWRGMGENKTEEEKEKEDKLWAVISFLLPILIVLLLVLSIRSITAVSGLTIRAVLAAPVFRPMKTLLGIPSSCRRRISKPRAGLKTSLL